MGTSISKDNLKFVSVEGPALKFRVKGFHWINHPGGSMNHYLPESCLQDLRNTHKVTEILPDIRIHAITPKFNECLSCKCCLETGHCGAWEFLGLNTETVEEDLDRCPEEDIKTYRTITNGQLEKSR